MNEENYKNSKASNVYFTIDIFSKYKGEKEVLELMQDIDNKVKELMELKEVMTINLDSFNILNDTDPEIKHGVLIYKFKLMEVL